MTDIRPGTEKDAPTLTAIACAAKRYWGYPQSWLEVWREDLTVTPRYIARNPVYVAVKGGVVGGFIALDVNGSRTHIDHCWVLPQHMGEGVGRLLLQYALRHCASVGVKRLWVVSDPNAKEFYCKLGAEVCGQTKSVPAPRTLPLLCFDVKATGYSK